MKKVKGIVSLIVEDQDSDYDQHSCEACLECDTGGSTGGGDHCQLEG